MPPETAVILSVAKRSRRIPRNYCSVPPQDVSTSLDMTKRSRENFLGKAWMLLRRHDKRGANDNQKERKELAACEWPDQFGIGLAEVFEYDSKDRVTNEKQSGENAIGLARASPHKPQNREQHHTLEESFIKLRRMPRRQNRAQRVRDVWPAAHCANDCVRCRQRWVNSCTGFDCALSFLRMIEQFLRELHRPRNIGNPPVQLAINEVRASSEEQSDRRRYDEVVAKVKPRNFVMACIVKREQQ